jgi:hypothetical protein
MPVIAGVVDEFRRVFGQDQGKVIYAEEAGRQLGKREAYEERAAIMEFDGKLQRQDAERKASTCHYCQYWQSTRSGKGWCCVGAPPVARLAGESCELFDLGSPPSKG